MYVFAGHRECALIVHEYGFSVVKPEARGVMV